MLATNPPRDGALINLELFGGDFLRSEEGNEVFENGIHAAPPYVITHIVEHRDTFLQGYGSASNNLQMEYKDRVKAARKHAKLTQAELGERVGIDQASISDLERGRSQRSSYNASIARACGVSAIWLENDVGEMLDGAGVDENGSPSAIDYALIPQLSAIGEGGNGHLNDHVEVRGGLAFKRDWLSRIHAKPQHLYVIYAEGSSMEPYIFEGDVVLVDHSCTEPKDRSVYAIRRPDGGISIKRLIRQMGGSWLVRSDNEDKRMYPDETASESSVHEMSIVGRVIWRGGAMS